MLSVELTDQELAIAWFVAEQRNRDAIRAGADEAKHGYKGSNLELHYQGCLGEMAFAKAFNRYWSGAGCSYHLDDDVGNVQIRVSAHENACLLVRPNDGALDSPWVLVIGEGRSYKIAGWMWGRDTRRNEWLRDPAGRPPAYFVPQDALRPVTKRRRAA